MLDAVTNLSDFTDCASSSSMSYSENIGPSWSSKPAVTMHVSPDSCSYHSNFKIYDCTGYYYHLSTFESGSVVANIFAG